MHGIDRFGQLSAARLIDAARVDPGVQQTLSSCLLACMLDFEVSFLVPHSVGSSISHLLEEDLFILPGVRQDSVRVFWNPDKLLEPYCLRIDEPHNDTSSVETEQLRQYRVFQCFLA